MMTIRQPLIQSILISLALCLSSTAYADMMISPTRVLMNDLNRSTTLTLRNPSDGPRSYRLSWQDKRASETGGYTMIEEGEAWPSIKGMVRYSPRQITVGPGENQTVRFSWRPPADLPAGEYRSHLLLQVIPDISEPVSTMSADGPEEGMGIAVHMQMSFSIPVVVRHSTQPPKVAISDVKAVPTNDSKHMGLAVTLDRVGNASSYGRVVVEMQRNGDSPIERIGNYKELSIFHELDNRQLTIPLRDASIPRGAWVRVAYEGIKEYQGLVFAEKVFQAE